MPYHLLHVLIASLYVALPVAALVVALVAWRWRGRSDWLWALLITSIAGAGVGAAVAVIFAAVVGGRPVPSQVLLTGYFGIALLLILKVLDWALVRGLRTLARPRRWRTAAAAPAAAPAAPDGPTAALVPVQASPFASVMVGLLRVVLLFAIGLPYVMAAVLTYRPKVAPGPDPLAQFGYAYQRVEFPATDGSRVVGWWIPAAERPGAGLVPDDFPDDFPAEFADDWGRSTVLVCHGMGGGKGEHLVMAGPMPAHGFNVLAVDLRGHGESDGNLTTFGDLERRDVLGAVRWLRATHPERSGRILGLGANAGAAALVAAAAHDSPEGRAIDALAIYGTFDDLGRLADSVSDSYFAPPLGWLLTHIGLPMASAQTGTDLAAFSPADLIDALWPRPLLVVHGRGDEIVSFQHGERLHRRATQPKYRLWVSDGSHERVLADERVARVVMLFYKLAESVRVI